MDALDLDDFFDKNDLQNFLKFKSRYLLKSFQKKDKIHRKEVVHFFSNGVTKENMFLVVF